MGLEELINRIKEDAEREIGALEKEHKACLEEIDKNGEQRMEDLREKEERLFAEEKEKALRNYRKKKEFDLSMELLSLKKDILRRASEKVKEKAQGMSREERSRIFKEKIKGIDLENSRISVPFGKKEEILSGYPAEEKDLGFEDGFVVEGSNFVLKVSLSDIVEEIMERNEDFFAAILFNS